MSTRIPGNNRPVRKQKLAGITSLRIAKGLKNSVPTKTGKPVKSGRAHVIIKAKVFDQHRPTSWKVEKARQAQTGSYKLVAFATYVSARRYLENAIETSNSRTVKKATIILKYAKQGWPQGLIVFYAYVEYWKANNGNVNPRYFRMGLPLTTLTIGNKGQYSKVEITSWR